MSAVLEVEGLTFAYGNRQPVLRDVSFSVETGERVGIVGGNGAGKSTLLWCILSLHRASGTVRLFGERFRRETLRRLGVVFQNPEDLLFMPCLIDDLTLPLLNRGLGREEAVSRAGELLGRMGLNGLEDEPAGHLSLGQRKRAAIAAALVSEPQLLILDEPTAELDARSERLLAEHLNGLPVTLVMTSHNLDFLERCCSRLLVLLDGRIAADGDAKEVMAQQDLLELAGLK